MSRIQRTAQGQLIDFAALAAVNEEVIAVGNANVNARGDELGPGGKIIRTRNEVMEEHYRLSQEAKATSIPAVRTPEQIAAQATPTPEPTPPDVDEPDLSDEQIEQLKQPKAKKESKNV